MSEFKQDDVQIELDNYQQLSPTQVFVLLISILVVALCAITYELIIGAAASYLLGNSVYQYSLTIGFFMFALGIGAYLSKLFLRNLLNSFIVIEIVISIVGGMCSISLFITFSALNAMFTPIMYFFIIVIGTLVGLEIPILTRILSQKEIIRKSIANVLSLDYVGALIGSVAFPLLLLPSVGLIRSSFVIGLLNIFTAIINLIYFRDYLKKSVLLTFAAISILILLIVLTLFGTHVTSYAEHHLYQDQVIYKQQTPYQKVVFTQNNSNGEYRMYIDGHIQFSQRDEHRYHEALVHPVMSLPGPRTNILILGGGDGMAAREILKYTQVEHIDLIDIDPAITQFSGRFPALIKMNHDSLNNVKLNIINTDAFSFINQKGKSYDRVIIDMPDPHSEALNKLYSREFYRMIKKRLHADGFIVTQSSSPFYVRRTYWSIEKTLRSAGLKTFSYNITVPSFGIWGYHVAGNKPIDPDTFSISVPTKFLTKETLAAASIFAKDIAPLDVPINTLLEPKLYSLYVEDLQK